MRMSYHWLKTHGHKSRRARRWAPVVLLLGMPASLWPQETPQETPQGTSVEPPRLPSGLRLNSVSSWVERNDLVVPNSAGQTSTPQMLWFGGGVDAGWYLPGKTTQASFDYSLAYNGNATYESLSGFDHNLVFSWNTKLTRRISLSVAGTGTSTTVNGFLFRSVANSAPDLSDAGTLAGSLTPAGTAGATNTLLFPARRQTAMVATTLTYSASRRVTWHVRTHGQRLLPSRPGDTSGQQTLGYGGETDTGANVALSYTLSRRTVLGADADYFRTFSPLGRTQVGSGGFTLTRVLSRWWFGSAQAGYGLGNYALEGSRTTIRRPDFRGSGTLGYSFNTHALSLSVERRIGDSYGFGAARTQQANLIWTWSPKHHKWGIEATGSYERLTGNLVNEIQSAIFRASLTRRLTNTLSCAAEGVYTWGIGQAASSLGRQNQDVARLSVVWRPAGIRR